MQQLQAQKEDFVCIAQYIKILDRTDTDLPKFFCSVFVHFSSQTRILGKNVLFSHNMNIHVFFFKVWVIKSPMT